MARTSTLRWSTIALIVFGALVASMLLATRFMAADGPSDLARGGPGQSQGADANPEAGEQGEEVEERAEAFEQAVDAGKAGKSNAAVVSAPAAGWAGESSSTRPPTTGSPRSPRTRAPRMCTS